MEHETSSSAGRNRVILLLGPTGSGKTPLGEMIRERGLRGARCLHFDFGANLREVVARNQAHESAGPLPVGEAVICRADVAFLRDVLHSGALLEDEQFPIARRILQWFMAREGADRDSCLVLNGLPRHVGQARAIDRILNVCLVVFLKCSSQTVLERIRTNAGGDRTSRTDDDLPSVQAKLAIFNERTAPLLEHYRRQGARVEIVEVTPEMTAEQMWETLQKTAGSDGRPARHGEPQGDDSESRTVWPPAQR